VTADLVLDCANQHGEGILWSPRDGRLWWTDIHGQRLFWHDPRSAPPSGGSGSHDLPRRLCAFAPRARGGWLMAFADGIELWTAGLTPERTLLVFEPDNAATRLNDGRTDRLGRFVVGGMNEGTGAADSTVIRVNADLSVDRLISGVACANSTCFSPDGGTMYFADTPDRCIRAYPYGDSLDAARIFVDMASEPGLPDGSCVDAEGGVWNAEWDGGQVIRIAPDGRISHRIALPVPKPTCCAFGGPDLATLYITTSRLGMTEDEIARAPLSGGLFAARPGFRGIEDIPFAG
jgi:L-arabinonolactonase